MRIHRALWLSLFLLSLFYPCLTVGSEMLVDQYLNGIYIHDCAIDGNYIWCATENHGIIRFDTRDDSWKEIVPDNAPPADRYRSVAVGRTGAKWFGAGTGIYRYDGSHWQRFTTGSGQLPYADSVLTVNSILVDNDNVLWFADLFNGIARYDGSEWKLISRLYYMEDGAVDPHTNDKWFRGPVVLKYDGVAETVFGPEEITPTNNSIGLFGIAIDGQSRVWIGGGTDIYRYDGAAWTMMLQQDGPEIHAMKLTDTGDLLLGTTWGLFGFDEGQLIEMNAAIPWLEDIEIAPNGDVWAVARGGSFDDIHNSLIRYRPTSVPVEEETPLVFEITGVRPNPFNPETVISFTLSKHAPVRLSVFTATGQKVATLLDSRMNAGSHLVRFNGSECASGVYFYRLESAGTARVGKMLLLR